MEGVIKIKHQGDSFKRPIPYLPSLEKKTVMVLYHVIIWGLIGLTAMTAAGLTTYDEVKIFFYIAIIVSGLLFPLFVNSHQLKLPERQIRRATISLVISFGVLIIAFLASIFLQAYKM